MVKIQCFSLTAPPPPPKKESQAKDRWNLSRRYECPDLYRLHGIGLLFVHDVVRPPSSRLPLSSSTYAATCSQPTRAKPV